MKKTRSVYYTVKLVLFSLILVLSSCSRDDKCELGINVKPGSGSVSVENIVSSTYDLQIGKEMKLELQVRPSIGFELAAYNVGYISSDESIVRVTEGGVIQALQNGDAKVTVIASTSEPVDDKLTTELDIRVTGDLDVLVSNISLKQEIQSTLLVEKGKEIDLAKFVTVIPADATNTVLDYKSSDTYVVAERDAILFALDTGRATVTVSTTDGSEVSTEFDVVVFNVDLKEDLLSEPYSLVKGVSVSISDLVSTAPLNDSDLIFEYTSSNPDVLAIEDGHFIGKAEGEAEVNVAIKNTDYAVSFKVEVMQEYIPITELVLKADKLELLKTQKVNLYDYVEILPVDATNKKLNFESTGANILSIDDMGNLEGVSTGEGSVEITTAGKEKVQVRLEVSVRDLIKDYPFDTKGWSVELSHKPAYDSGKDTGDNPLYLIDGSEDTFLSMVKPGKSLKDKQGVDIKVGASEKVHYIIDFKEVKSFNVLELRHRRFAQPFLKLWAFNLYGFNEETKEFEPIQNTDGSFRYDCVNAKLVDKHNYATDKYEFNEIHTYSKIKIEFADYNTAQGSAVQMALINVGLDEAILL